MTVSWQDVARKDFEDAVRSRLLWGLTAVFVAFLAMSLLSAEQLFPEPVTVDAAMALSGVAMLAQLFVPGIALAVGYTAVVGERRSGSLRVLLSYPFSRGEVVAGKLAGRLLVTGTALAIGFAAASVLVVALYGVPDAATFVGFVAAGVLLGLTFTALAVGGSATASTRGRARTLTIGSFVGMVFFWKPVVVGIYYVVTGSLPGVQAESWYFLLKRLNPLEAYRVVAGAVLDERVDAVPEFPLEDVPANAPAETLELSNRLAGEVPFYLADWFSAVVLLAWGLVPVLAGYRLFEDADLG
ncbi:NosY protein [Haloterrigena turkmenica DSM 5511]|uniref:NosY protein n=1 Tax=Haloterrigena turkmenica (strain ATCC 51198 / DSM 5511 / JCM 9101 / NCIMB 13204 / VKM B-1734 / 4k) TaxID=543526 RepID=D2RTJ8_HALTV|nr:ABC transporter permease subunit [Haloterrigena turkmenica]ADB59041.1 NosY protein [Haloterrigena turkmenica DSM 5511]